MSFFAAAAHRAWWPRARSPQAPDGEGPACATWRGRVAERICSRLLRFLFSCVLFCEAEKNVLQAHAPGMDIAHAETRLDCGPGQVFAQPRTCPGDHHAR